MDKWAITHRKYSPEHNEVITYASVIDAISLADAFKRATDSGLMNVKVQGLLISEIDLSTGRKIDYDITRNN